jgi:mannose-6-phosphate isomerase-like protein (cupin superfamily)
MDFAGPSLRSSGLTYGEVRRSSAMIESPWKVFDIEKVKAGLKGAPVEYREFLRAPTLSCGIYTLRAGAKDMQSPHDEDEVYFVVSGRATLRVGDETHDVKPGSVLYVRATEEHSFFEIEEDMTLLVFFAAAV